MPLLSGAFWDINMSKFYTTLNVFIRIMASDFFNNAASWVHSNQTIAMSSQVPDEDIARALSALHATAMQCQASVMIPDLFPGSEIEILFIPALEGRTTSTVVSANVANAISTTALSAIGSALAAEMERTGTNMARYEFDNSSQAIAYQRCVRGTVLKATNLVLLND
jgi:predicted regulator of Ras-like GTPase activity (Roadblock/LC7/MglB family)